MNRRNFVGLLGMAGAVAAIAPKVFASIQKRYVLYGDGEHDDTEAFQAWADGKEVYHRDGRLAERGELRGGTYLIAGTITLQGDYQMSHCHFRRIGGEIASPILVAKAGSHTLIDNCSFTGQYVSPEFSDRTFGEWIFGN